LSTNTRAEAFAPASMANVGVGFDILGLAFQEPGDVVCVELRDEPGISLSAVEGDGGALPRDPAKNTATVAIGAYLKIADIDAGISVIVRKGLPLASGLGSSAASAVAGVVAANALFGEPLTREELLPACLEGEALVSGYHVDNAGPSLVGGITLITGTENLEIRRLPVPADMYFAVITPNVAVPTLEARAVLPETVPLRTMVAQTGAVAQLIDALYRGDVAAAAAAMERDYVVEPARAHLMPLLAEARAEAKRGGALGLVISGAGPTLCAVCDSETVARDVTDRLQALYDDAAIGGVARCTRVDEQGARVTEVV
jgi:homoserine kinase